MAKQSATDRILSKVRKDNRSFEPKSPIATGMYLPNHSGDHSAGIVNTTPVLEKDLVNKEYVDGLIHGNVELFLTEDASDIATYFDLAVDSTGNSEETTVQAIGGNSTALIASYASILNETEIENITALEGGVYSMHIHASADFPRGMTIYFEFYRRTSLGAETLLGTSHDSDILTASESQQELHANVSGDLLWNTGDRVVVKVYGRNTNAASKNITIFVEGDTLSRVEFPAFIPPAEGGFTGTAGSIPFVNAGGSLTEDNANLFWNNASKELQPNRIRIEADGTQANPALKFNDTNTGFFKSGDSVRFSLNNSTIMTIDATGVGIGTSIPSTLLEVVREAGTDPVSRFTIFGSATDTKLELISTLHVSDQALVDGFGCGIMFEGKHQSDANVTFGGVFGVRDGADTEGALIFNAGTNGAETFMKIDNDGNVGIGIASPIGLLHMKSPTGVNANLIVDTTDSNDATSDAVIQFREAGVTKWYMGNDGSVDDFKIGLTGFSSTIFSIFNEGIVRIDRPTTTTTFDILQLVSNVGGVNNVKWRVEADGDTISDTNSYTSDERVKRNIEPITNGLEIVQQLKPISFEWIEGWSKDGINYGFTAQDLEKVLPSLVRDDGLDSPQFLKDQGVETIKATRPNDILAILVSAVQELKAEVDFLKTKSI